MARKIAREITLLLTYLNVHLNKLFDSSFDFLQYVSDAIMVIPPVEHLHLTRMSIAGSRVYGDSNISKIFCEYFVALGMHLSYRLHR